VIGPYEYDTGTRQPRHSLPCENRGSCGSRAFLQEAKATEGVKVLEMQRRRTRRGGWGRNDHTVGRGTGEIRLGPETGVPSGCRPAVTGRDDAYKQRPCEVAKCRAEVGGGSSSDDGGDNTTPLERRASSQVCVKTGDGSWDCRFGYSPIAVVDGGDPRAGGIAGIVGQGAWRHRMLAIDCLGESRVRENLTHGLGRGRWRRSSQTHGDGLSPRWETSGPRQPGLQVWVATAPAPYFTVVVPGPATGLKRVPNLSRNG
jgi:hypothetical protein